MAPRSRRRLATLAAGSALALAVTGGALSAVAAPSGNASANAGKNASTDGPNAPTGQDPSSAVVRLSLDPAASTATTTGGELDLASQSAKSQRAQLTKQRNDFKQWLKANAPKAKVTGEYDVAVNAVAVTLNGTALSTLRSAPGVVSADYQAVYRPSAHQDPDLALIRGMEGWTAAKPVGGATKAGTGVQVAIIDTGIDVTHPCFADAGFPATKQLGDTRFTNNKVIVAKVFNNKAPNLKLTPEAIQDHGTHVAGTVACNAHTPAKVQGAEIPYAPSGVAPGAQLGNYNVFPGQVDNARSEDILNAMQAAAEDGMDVINMSLGGGASGTQDLLTMAVDNLDRAGIVVAVASGNSGPGRGTVESPGSAERALTAGASTVGHFVGTPIKDASGNTVAVAAIGDFPTPQSDITAKLAKAAGSPLGNGCDAGQFGSDMQGAIALISRGSCTFGQKVHNAEQAGAVAAIIVNNVPGDPIAMAADAAFPSTIPAVQAGLADRDKLVALVGSNVTMGSTAEYTRTAHDNIMADFSSQGPTDVTFRVKPDVVAPGVNVLSSVPHQSCKNPGDTGCWAFMQGTSMATPHLAGMAAVVMQAHPGWSAEEVRSAIVNTAQEGKLKQSREITALETSVQVTGAGLADLKAAVGADVAVGPVSTSFGAVPSGSGQTITRTVTVTDLTGAAQTLPVAVDGRDASGFKASASSVKVPAGGSATLTVTFTAGKQAAAGEYQATLRLGDIAHSVLFALVK
ncbi:MAG TPA: S8 family serine peptidase [Actinomycetales bacterium]|nr:S8 family serine peptidase [Actinomycetales bacterium]